MSVQYSNNKCIFNLISITRLYQTISRQVDKKFAARNRPVSRNIPFTDVYVNLLFLIQSKIELDILANLFFSKLLQSNKMNELFNAILICHPNVSQYLANQIITSKSSKEFSYSRL